MLTMVAPLRAQQRNILEYMAQSVQAAWGTALPSLLPQTTSNISKI
jgi:hypothetical protein